MVYHIIFIYNVIYISYNSDIQHLKLTLHLSYIQGKKTVTYHSSQKIFKVLHISLGIFQLIQVDR